MQGQQRHVDHPQVEGCFQGFLRIPFLTCAKERYAGLASIPLGPRSRW